MMKPLLVFLVCAMSGIVTQPKPDPSQAARSLSRPYAQFGFDLLRDLATTHHNTNLFISPASIAVALAMTSNGAQGATRDAILKTLHADGQSAGLKDIDSFNTANHALVALLSSATSARLAALNESMSFRPADCPSA